MEGAALQKAMRVLRNFISFAVTVLLAFYAWHTIAPAAINDWQNRLNYLFYPVLVIICIFSWIIIDLLISRLFSLLDWVARNVLGFLYGITGKDSRERKISAKKALAAALFARWSEAARNYLNAGLYRQAATCFEKARDFGPAADCWQKGGENHRAAEAFARAGNFESAAECYKALGRHAEAVKCFTDAGEQFLESGKTLTAAEAFFKAHQYRRSGDLFEKSGHSKRAAESFELAGEPLRAAQVYLEAAKKRILVIEKRTAFDKPVIKDQELLECGHKAAELFQSVGAFREALEACLLAGDNAKAVEICIGQGLFDEAAEICENAQMWDEALVCYRRTNNKSKALSTEARIAMRESDTKRAAKLFEEAGNLNQALEQYRISHDLLGQARCLERMGRPLAAANYYASAGEILTAADLYEQSGSMQEAAELYRSLGMLEKASRCMADVNNPYYAALLEKERGNTANAIEILRHITFGTCDYKKAMVLLGQCYCDCEKPALAVDALDRVVPSLPLAEDSLDAFYIYARALEETTNISGARDYYQKILSIKSSFKDTRERLSRLDSSLGKKPRTSLEQLAKSRKADQDSMRIRTTQTRQQPSREALTPTIQQEDPTIQEDVRTVFEDTRTVLDDQKTILDEDGDISARKTICDDVSADLKTIVEDSPATPSANELETRYQIMDVIGGSTGLIPGTLFRARDIRKSRIVALKKLGDLVWTSPRHRGQFMALMKQMEEVRHPAIIRIFEYGHMKDTPYIVMEYLEGGNLQERAEQEEGLEPAEALRTMRILVEGLALAHQKGIYHGDIRPGNILFSENGEPKLGDFGLSAIVSDATRVMEKADRGRAAAVQYMSPELIHGAPPGPAADIYSLGLCFFFMLVGKTPFDIARVTETDVIIDAHLKGAFPRPDSIKSGIPASYSGLFQACVHTNPQERLSNTGDLLRRINALA